MKIEDSCIKFKSDTEMYEHEVIGVKPNTVRLLTRLEYNNLKDNADIKYIRITNTDTGEWFTRDLKSVIAIDKYFDLPANKRIVVFSWILG